MGQYSQPYILQRERERIQTFLDVGLNECYKDFGEFLYDYYPDFSWAPEEAHIQYGWLLHDPEWVRLSSEVYRKLGFDFFAGVQAAYDDPEGLRYNT